MRKMCTLITSKGTDIDENIANQNHATRTRTPKPGYLNLSIIDYTKQQHLLNCIEAISKRVNEMTRHVQYTINN
jgi:hypothetical protein